MRDLMTPLEVAMRDFPPKLASRLPLICGLVSGLILLALWRSYGTRFSAHIPFFRRMSNRHETPISSAATAKSVPLEPEILPPIDLTVGDFGDISKVRRDHPLFRNGRASDLNPIMNDTRMTPQRIASEFSQISDRLAALERK